MTFSLWGQKNMEVINELMSFWQITEILAYSFVNTTDIHELRFSLSFFTKHSPPILFYLFEFSCAHKWNHQEEIVANSIIIRLGKSDNLANLFFLKCLSLKLLRNAALEEEIKKLRFYNAFYFLSPPSPRNNWTKILLLLNWIRKPEREYAYCVQMGIWYPAIDEVMSFLSSFGKCQICTDFLQNNIKTRKKILQKNTTTLHQIPYKLYA